MGPHIHLRADANRGWDPPTAVEFFTLLERHPEVALEYIEEPMRMACEYDRGHDGMGRLVEDEEEENGEGKGEEEEGVRWWGRVAEAAQKCGVLLAFDEHVDQGMFCGSG